MALENSLSKLDMTGKLIIKASLGEDIRRIPIHNDDLTYDELVLMMQRVFRGVLDPEEELLLKYKDEDGDLVTIMDNSDLSFAIQYCRVLRLTIICGVVEKTTVVGQVVVKELREIRDRVNMLLDMVTDSPKGPSGDDGEVAGDVEGEDGGHVEQIRHEGNKEFDPLGQEQVQQDTSSFTTEVVTAPDMSIQTATPSSYQAVASTGYQAPAPPTTAGYQAPAPPTTAGYPVGYPATTAAYAPPTTNNFQPPPTTSGYAGPTTSTYPATTAAYAAPTNNFPPTTAGYQAGTFNSLPASTSTPSNYPTTNYPTQPPPSANYPPSTPTPSTVPPTSYPYPSPQPTYSPYQAPSYRPTTPGTYPTQPTNPYSRGPVPQQGYQHTGTGGQGQHQQ
eukprot:GFUD01119726.1.p1 GENE.GFUD01119726.1~~GFUD01119726.1.p1  ORF type:complete len:390 (-),score=138.46 GFUD01119726.1:55-1224(-)